MSSDNLLETITTLLEQFIAKNKENEPAVAHESSFDSKDPPPITLRNYVARLDKYFRCSNECYVIAVIFIDRLIQAHKIRISSLNVHRALLACLVVAAKMRDDTYYSNKYYAQVGGVEIKELNYLEVTLLTSLNWNLYVSYDDCCVFLHELRTRYGEFDGKTGELLAKWEKTPGARAYKAELRRMTGGASSGESSSDSAVDEEEVEEEKGGQPDASMRGCPFSMDSVVDSAGNVSSIGNSTGDSDDAEMCDDSGSFGSYYQNQQTEQWARGHAQSQMHMNPVYYPNEPWRYENAQQNAGWGYGYTQEPNYCTTWQGQGYTH